MPVGHSRRRPSSGCSKRYPVVVSPPDPDGLPVVLFIKGKAKSRIPDSMSVNMLSIVTGICCALTSTNTKTEVRSKSHKVTFVLTFCSDVTLLFIIIISTRSN